MRFLALPILFLTGSFAFVTSNSIRPMTYMMRHQMLGGKIEIGDDPLGHLTDADELQDSSPLDQLVEGMGIGPKIQPPISPALGNTLMSTRLLGMFPGCPSSVSLFNGREDVMFVLYNKNWPHGVNISGDMGAGKLIPKAKVKFLIHGFLNSENSMMIQVVKNAYMARDEDYNIIAVDWTKGSGTWLTNYFNCLITSRIVPKVGEAIASFIIDLVENKDVSLLSITLIGHSLGAQIAGRAGKKLIEQGYKLPIIVGLDPALPSFKYSPETERLCPTDAEYVEVIHTNPDDLGFELPIGTADYYPNYGLVKRNRQPNCITPACSHAMSFKLFAESVINPNAFEAKKCTTFEALKEIRCDNSGARALNAYMGGPNMYWGKQPGIFYLETNKDAPYGKGWKS